MKVLLTDCVFASGIFVLDNHHNLILQEILWNCYQKEEERKALLSRQASAKDVEILCKGCRTFLCFGSDIILKGQAYICVSDDFEAKVKIEEDPEFKEFRDDVQIG